MTQPLQPIGLTPKTADEVNNNVGVILRRFVDDKESINHMAASLAGINLQDPPYNMTQDQETAIKSAINSADTYLDAFDMTFVNQVVGGW